MINVEEHINLVHLIARKRHSKYKHRYAYEDFFQNGCIGLIKAAKKFDESKGIQFGTYAYPVIDGHVLLTVRDDSWCMCKREERYFAKEPISLDRPINISLCGENEELTLLDMLEDHNNEYESVETKMAIENLLDILPERLRQVIKLKYIADLNQTKIGDKLNCSQITISRLHKKALDMLREEIAI